MDGLQRRKGNFFATYTLKEQWIGLRQILFARQASCLRSWTHFIIGHFIFRSKDRSLGLSTMRPYQNF